MSPMREVPLSCAARWVVAWVLMVCAVAGPAVPAYGQIVSESFQGSTAPGWILGESAVRRQRRVSTLMAPAGCA